MYAYGVLTLPLVEHCARHVKEADQQCYADDFAASGSLRTCAKYLKELRKIGPTVFGYFPEVEKTLVNVHERCRALAVEIFEDEGLPCTVCGGSPYLGGYVGNHDDARAYAAEKTAMSFFVKSRMSLAILRSTTHVLYGERKILEVRREQPAFFHDNSALLGYWSTSRWS